MAECRWPLQLHPNFSGTFWRRQIFCPLDDVTDQKKPNKYKIKRHWEANVPLQWQSVCKQSSSSCYSPRQRPTKWSRDCGWGVDMILSWATPLLALVSGSCLRWITYNYRILLQWPTQELSHILHKLHSKDNFLNLGVKFAKRWQTSSSATAWNPGCDPEDIGRKSPHFTSHIIYATCFLLSERIPLPHTARQRIKSIKQSPNQSMSWCFDNRTPPSARSLIPGAGDPLGGRH